MKDNKQTERADDCKDRKREGRTISLYKLRALYIVTCLEKDYGINVDFEMKKDIEEMCNLSEGIYEDGYKAGLAAGRKKERKEIAKRMLADGMNNEKVAQYSGLSLMEVQKLVAGK